MAEWTDKTEGIAGSFGVRDEDSEIFAKCVRRLLGHTFIVKDREQDRKLWQFVSKDENRQNLSAYLRMAGLALTIDRQAGVCMVNPDPDGAGMTGTDRLLYRFEDAEQYHILLAVWEVYEENPGYPDACVITKGDLVDRLQSLGVNPESRVFFNAMDRFKKFRLVDFNRKDFRSSNDEAEVILYPSLHFCWDQEQFHAVAESLIAAAAGVADRSEEDAEDDPDRLLETEDASLEDTLTEDE